MGGCYAGVGQHVVMPGRVARWLTACGPTSQWRLFRFMCALPRFENGTLIEMGPEARPTTAEDAIAMAPGYVAAVDAAGVGHFDAALVDGRFRAACALRLLQVRAHSFSWLGLRSAARCGVAFTAVAGYLHVSK